MATQRERRTATQNSIVAAAADAFVANDDIEIPLATIAADAGVAKSTVLYHFGSRVRLLRAVAAHLLGRLEARIGATSVDEPALWIHALLQQQATPDARVLHRIGDELARRGALAGADPLTYLVDRISATTLSTDPVVAAAATLHFGRQVAYGLSDVDEIDGFIRALSPRTEPVTAPTAG